MQEAAWDLSHEFSSVMRALRQFQGLVHEKLCSPSFARFCPLSFLVTAYASLHFALDFSHCVHENGFMQFPVRMFGALVVFIFTACQSFNTSSYSSAYNSASLRSESVGVIPTAAPVPDEPIQTAALPANSAVRPLVRPRTPAPKPGCAAVCVMDAMTGQVLYEYNGNVRRQVASTQKVLSALVILDAGRLSKTVTIAEEDTKAAPTKLGFKAGEKYRREDLLHALMVRSFNDVALALARDTAGSVSNFVSRMNSKARRLGMYNSHFVNPNGLPASQYSTAVDMARCAWFAYRNPVLRRMVCDARYDFRLANGRIRTLANTNKLLSRYSWVTGFKTGYTNAAGKCLISTGGYNGRHVIVVVLGSTNAHIWDESAKYLKWALELA